MNKLSKSQKDEYATAFAILALYDGGVSSVFANVVAYDVLERDRKPNSLFVSIYIIRHPHQLIK